MRLVLLCNRTAMFDLAKTVLTDISEKEQKHLRDAQAQFEEAQQCWLHGEKT